MCCLGKGVNSLRTLLLSLVIALPLAAQRDQWVELNKRAMDLYSQGKYAEAVPLAQEDVRLAEKIFGPAHANVAASLTNLATLYHAQMKYSEAEQTFKRALDIWENLVGQDDPRLADPLANLAVVYHDEAKYALEEPLLKRTLLIREKALGAVHPDVAEALNNLAAAYRAQGHYADAEQFYQGALAVDEAALGKEHPDVAVILNNLAELYGAMGRYPEAEQLCERALAIYKNAPGEPDKNESAVLSNMAVVYQRNGEYAKAESLYKGAVAIRERAMGEEHPAVAALLNSLADFYRETGQYGKAEPLYERALRIDRNALGSTHPSVARDLGNLGDLYFAEGRYADAEPLFQRSLAVNQEVLGNEHPDVATCMGNLALLDYARGKYTEAQSLAQRALDIDENVLGKEHPSVANSLITLALLYRSGGRDGEAELMLRRALTIYEKALGKANPRVATAIGNLAQLYESQGKYPEAEALYRQALTIREGAQASENPDVAVAMNDLASLCRAQGKNAEAEELFQHALAVNEKALGKEHPFVAASLTNLALLYKEEGKFADAEPLERRALKILQATLGDEHPDLARSLNNLGGIEEGERKYAEAEALFKHALAIDEKALGGDNPRLADYLNNLAGLYYSEGKYAQALPLFDRARQLLQSEFVYQFSYMSERDRLAFLGKVAGNSPLYYNFCFAYSKDNPTLIGKMYDAVLWDKGLVARSVAAGRAKIRVSGDKEALALFEELTALRGQLASLRNRPANNVEQWRETVRQLQQKCNDLEAGLVRRVGALEETKKVDRATWQDVQRALRPGEAAVEFVRFPYHDGNKWTDKSYYVALLVTPESAPVLVPLGEAGKLEAEPLTDYRNRVAQVPPEGAGVRFYQAFWKPLEAPLRGHTRIYIAPDGVLNEVSFAVVPTEDGPLLMDKYDIDPVLSTKDVLRQPHYTGENSAVLIGNPKFNLGAAEQKTEIEKLEAGEVLNVRGAMDLRLGSIARGPQNGDCRDLPPGGVLCPLRNTQVEVDMIFSRLQQANWDVKPPYTGERALKEVVTHVQHPRLLHVATHGFFSPDQERKSSGLGVEFPSGLQDPMLRSGLMFAGADRALKGETPANGVNDGVLTAYEASALDLEGTELVVLSACETGLGAVENGEGVFGLRRALQEAGAESVLMSMWSVKDQETRELMTLFHERWLSGGDKHEALHEAQLEMRKRTKARWDGEDRPYYWGAFVLVGR